MKPGASQVLGAAFVEAFPDQAAALLEPASAGEVAAFLGACADNVAARALEQMVPDAGGRCLTCLPADRVAGVLGALDPERAARMLRTLEPDDREKVLAAGPSEIVATLERTLRFPEETVGALMNPAAFALPLDIPAAEAQRRIRRVPSSLRYYIYATDRDGVLAGVVDPRELLRASANQSVKDIARPTSDHISAWTPVETAAAHPAWERYRALPVVDERSMLLGVLGAESLPGANPKTSDSQSTLPLGIGLVHLYWVATTTLFSRLLPAARPKEADHET